MGTSTRLEKYKQARLLLSTGSALVTVGRHGGFTDSESSDQPEAERPGWPG